MRKLLINLMIIASAGLTACSSDNRYSVRDMSLPDLGVSKLPGIYRIQVQQGNLITQEMVNELRPGMTKQQVRFLLGTPLLVDSFHPERWDYLYTNRPESKSANTPVEEKKLSLLFKNDRLAKISGDMHPQSEQVAKATKEESREKTVVIPPGTPKSTDDNLLSRLVSKVSGDDAPQPPPPDIDEEDNDEPGILSRMWDAVTGANKDESASSEQTAEETKETEEKGSTEEK